MKTTLHLRKTEYAGNFIYGDFETSGTTKLQFFSHPEGYVEPVADGLKVKGFDIGGPGVTYSSYRYVYNYTDHLGTVRLSYSDLDLNGAIDPNTEILEEKNYYPFGLQHKGYNNVVNGTENNYKTYQGQELSKEIGYNMLEFRYRHYDPSIGRFATIDPLAEDYTYNSTYAFQENKLGMGIELEGAELLGNEIAQYLTIKYSQWKSNVSGYQSNLHKAIGSRVEAHKNGQERSNVTVGNINVNQVHDAQVISESVNGIAKETANIAKEITRDTANGMETVGDGITAVGIVTLQPEIVAVGETISTTGTAINVGLDLAEGKSPMDIAIDKAPSIIIGKLGKEATKATRAANGGTKGNEVTETIIKAHEKVYEKIVDEVKTRTSNDN